MSKQLFPVIEVPKIVSGSKNNKKRDYRPSVKWDAQKGDFVLDGSNRMVRADGMEAYRTWCIKAVLTERYACLSYPGAVGAELEAARKEPSNEAVESSVERTITETLMVNPRTEYVRGFSFSWNGDALNCSFVVKGRESAEFALQVNL